MKLLKARKGMFDMKALIYFVIALLVISIVIAIALYANTKVGDKMPANSEAQNATIAMTAEIAEVPGWVGILVVGFFGILIIGGFIGLLYMFNQQR